MKRLVRTAVLTVVYFVLTYAFFSGVLLLALRWATGEWVPQWDFMLFMSPVILLSAIEGAVNVADS